MAMECHHLDTATSLVVLDTWNFHATSIAARRTIYISWKLLPLDFIKVNFDGSIHDASGGVGFVILDPESRLLGARGSFLYELSIPEAELRASWTGITWAIQELHANRILIKGESSIVIEWIQDRSGQHHVNLLLCDIWRSLDHR